MESPTVRLGGVRPLRSAAQTAAAYPLGSRLDSSFVADYLTPAWAAPQRAGGDLAANSDRKADLTLPTYTVGTWASR